MENEIVLEIVLNYDNKIMFIGKETTSGYKKTFTSKKDILKNVEEYLENYI